MYGNRILRVVIDMSWVYWLQVDIVAIRLHKL